MRDSRCMSLLPRRTTLHSDSEQLLNKKPEQKSSAFVDLGKKNFYNSDKMFKIVIVLQKHILEFKCTSLKKLSCKNFLH